MFVVLSKLIYRLLFLLSCFSSLTVLAQDLPPLTHGLTELQPSIEAPAMRLTNMDDELIDLADLRGKTVVVNFWATWCPPCRREMASLEQLHLALSPRDVVVLAVNIGEDVDTVFPFLGEVDPEPTFPILFDVEAASLEAWQVKGLPTTYVVGPQGRVLFRAVGGREFNHPEILETIGNIGK